jgi:hypothetical protein
MAQARQSARVKTRPTTQIQDFARFVPEQRVMNPCNMLVDGFRAATGAVMLLGKVLQEHALAEIGIIPGDIVAFRPGIGIGLTANDVE